jgi:hypothetical protein
MKQAFWRNSAAIAALVGASMAATIWLAAPRGEQPAATPAAAVPSGAPVQPAAPAPTFGAISPVAAPGDPNGRWVGSMDVGGGARAGFRFELHAAGGVLTGTASVPIGDAGIVNGKVSGNHISFDTRHRIASTGQSVLTSFSGEIDGDTIALDLNSEGAVSHLLVQRATP